MSTWRKLMCKVFGSKKLHTKNCKGIKLNRILEKYGTVPYERYKIRMKKEKKWQVWYEQIVKDCKCQLKCCAFYFRKF